MWEIYSLINPQKEKETSKELFEVQTPKWQLPELTSNRFDDAFDEIELLGFSLGSPIDILKDKSPVTLTAKELNNHINETVSIVGYLVNVKNTSTSKGERMCFGTFTDTEGRWIDTVHFPPTIKNYPFVGPGCYLLKGKVTVEFDFMSIEISEMHRLSTVDREII